MQAYLSSHVAREILFLRNVRAAEHLALMDK
jgi:hypothetical protein